MTRMKVAQALRDGEPQQQVDVRGWVRTCREKPKFSFIEINDGSCMSNLQAVVDAGVPGYAETIKELSTGASVAVTGTLQESPGKGQRIELHAEGIEVIGTADPENYPLQKKRHSFEFLRDIAHLRPRTNTLGAVARVRNALSMAIHDFLQSRGFLYVHTPIITTSDCEGAGAMFQVSTLDPARLAQAAASTEGGNGGIDYGQDFFGKPAYLTVSGQLEAEIYACSLGDCYTFGPTFRAEDSHTARHLSEFWMVEPEMPFYDLNDNMQLAEEFTRGIIAEVLERCREDMEFFNRHGRSAREAGVSSGARVSPDECGRRQQTGPAGLRIDETLLETLANITENDFIRLPYTEAIDILAASGRQWEFPVQWGRDLQSEHERFLTEEHFRQPVILYDWPRSIKPFYMRVNDDGRTVRAMDVLVPKAGEIIGGSQREEREDVLVERMRECDLDPDEYWWYVDLRRFGTVPHSGFGLGLERTLQLITGMQNIRDVIPFPRTPKNAEF